MVKMTKRINDRFAIECKDGQKIQLMSYGGKSYYIGDPIQRLADIENKMAQGYIKILPVKAGDKIYVVPSKASYGINRMHKTFRDHNRVYTQTVDEIRFFKNGVYMVYSCMYQQNHGSEFLGETWFLEYEQAENRLKEMEAFYARKETD